MKRLHGLVILLSALTWTLQLAEHLVKITQPLSTNQNPEEHPTSLASLFTLLWCHDDNSAQNFGADFSKETKQVLDLTL